MTKRYILVIMVSAHLAQVGFFQPVVEGMRASGVAVDRLLKKAGLHRFNLDVPENYVPQFAVRRLFELIRKQQRIDDFLSEFGNYVQISQLANWGSTLSHRSDLLAACQFAVQYGHVVLTNERIRLEIKGRKAKVSLLFLDLPASDWSQMEYVNFAYMYSTFSLAAGADTAPDEIHLQTHDAPDLDVLLPQGNNTRVLLGQPSTALVFPVEILAAPMLGLDNGPESDTPFPERPPAAADLIAPILDAWVGDRIPKLGAMCNELGVSVRTLQRRIAAEGKTYSEIVDHWRFTTGIGLLSDSGMTIKEIAARLGYANTANFDRAFTRWTGLAPSRYREGH